MIAVDEDGCVRAHADPRKQGKSVVINQVEKCSD
jgi:hypothetical protein